YDEIDGNLEHQKKLIYRFLNFEEGPNRALLVNNYDFYQKMNVLDFLRDVGKTLTVNYMMSKESVRKRIETGISFTEFSYQLLQGYDYQCLFREHGCTVQMGGSDQWGNITAGTEFIRKNLGESAFAMTTPLLTKADGSKFGKSEKGNLWIDDQLTTAYQFYQFWINADDADLPKFIRYFTFKSREEVEAMESEHAGDPQTLKRLLAEELTVRIHSQEAYESVLKVSELLFGRGADRDMLLSMRPGDLQTVAGEIPSFRIARDTLAGGVNIVDLLSEHTTIVQSKGEARRAIQNNAISVNKERIGNHETSVNHEALLHGKYLMVENGKRNKFMLIAE
ncbi:MAG: tyrosine--tRNA ligase, partial [Saprospiraceae bacterium]|nr:tyrosine--tRNA ligase [Saprospiraceae bacterium]